MYSTGDGVVGEADDEASTPKPPVGSAGRLFKGRPVPGRTCRPSLWLGTPLVPVTCGAPTPLGPPLVGCCDDGAVELRDTAAADLCRNPGHTNASSSSATSSPAPAAAAAGRRTTTVLVVPPETARLWAPAVPMGRVSCSSACKSCMTCSFSSIPARIGSNSGPHGVVHSPRRPWQVPHWLRCRATVSLRAAGSTTMGRRIPSCGSPSGWASASICRSSPHPGALPAASRDASAAASEVTSTARSIACRFSRRSRRTSAMLVPSSSAACWLSRPLATNRSKSRCRGSGSVATICPSQCRSDSCLAGDSRVSGTSAATWACTASQLMSSIPAGRADVRASMAMPSSQPRSRSGRASFAGSGIARRAAMRTSPAAATAASASGHSSSAQQHSTASRCWRTTSANTAARSRSVWACLNRRTSAASARLASLVVIAATPSMTCRICWSAGCHGLRTCTSGYAGAFAHSTVGDRRTGLFNRP